MKVREKISEILSELTGIDTINTDDALQEDLGLNSIQMVTLLIMIEDNLKRLIQKSEGMNEIENKNVTDDPQNQKACS